LNHSGSPGIRAQDIWVSPLALEGFYENFATGIDDLSGITITGDATTPEKLIDNLFGVGDRAEFDVIGEYIELDFGAPVYIGQFRYYGHASHNEDGVYKIQAYINGAWVDVKNAIPTILGDWSAWTDLTIPSIAIRWRVVATTIDTNVNTDNKAVEWEFSGVRIS